MLGGTPPALNGSPFLFGGRPGPPLTTNQATTLSPTPNLRRKPLTRKPKARIISYVPFWCPFPECSLHPCDLPRPGSKDPNNRVLGPKYYNINSIWALKPYYLGPWTLREDQVLSSVTKPDFSVALLFGSLGTVETLVNSTR